ncbi:MAG: hypothetical protein K2I20_05035 [Clostridia bacterium]|nr:hypothetical protein [Clostridia bacterium]
MGKTNNYPSRRPTKWAALVTYVIALVCLLAGLLIPLGKEGFKLENMLAYQLPKAVEAVVMGAFQIPFGAELTAGYSLPVNFFGMFEYDLGALLVTLYAVITVAALVGLIPVIASSKKKATALKTASFIECLALIPLLTLVLMQMYAYPVSGTFSYALLIAFGGTLLMLVVQAFVYRKGSGAIKFVLFLLSAIAVVATMFNLGLFIPALADVLDGKLTTGLYGAIMEGPMFVELLFTGNFETLLSGDALAQTLTFATLIAALLVFINLYLDILGLGKRTKKFMVVTNLIRYSLEVLAVLLTFVMTFFVDGTVTLSIPLVALLVIAIVQLVINIIRTVTFGKHKKKAPKKARVEETEGEEAKEPEKKLSKKEQKRLAKEEQKAAKEREAEEKKAAKEKATEEKKAVKEEKAAPEKPMEVREGAGYFVYTGPTDSFINKLNNTEKQEFFNVFLERNVISLPNIPQYVPGGKNEKFFSAVFIYFGKVRDYVSDGLLNKLYEQINMM